MKISSNFPPIIVISGRFPLCLDNETGSSLTELKSSVSVTNTSMFKVESFNLDNISLKINYIVQGNYYGIRC